MAEIKDTITIVIPTYRRPELLEQALASAIGQTVPAEDYKILVVDNDPAADTETEQLVRRMAAPNLTYVKNEKNLGGYGNWNRGFQLAETEWVCLLHDDDLLLPTCIESARCILDQFGTPRLGAVIPKQVNLYDDPEEELCERQEKTKNWKARLDTSLERCTQDRLWKIGLFDNYIICSAYPALSGGNLLRRSAVLEVGGFGTTWPCEDIFLMNRLAQRYDCWLLGCQWGWYRFGANNMWSKPEELVKWDRAKKLFREGAAGADRRCAIYHCLFGQAMCFFDQAESIRFAARRGTVVDPDRYEWLADMHVSRPLRRLCRANRNLWHMWMSLRAAIFGKRIH